MMKMARAFGLGITAVLLFALDARALPREGDARPDVTLTDAWDRRTRLSGYIGEPMLVVYEDKDSASVNDALKRELARLAKGERYRSSIALIPVADVTGYDYWPIRGFVKSAVQGEAKKQGVDIFCDWDGHVRDALGLRRGTSNVVLYGKDGKVLFAGAGALSSEDCARVVGLLRREVGE